MNSKNCPNCAAPYDPQLNKCPYCGASYFDMSCIDVDGGEPFYLKLKMNGMTFAQKVLVDPNVSIRIEPDSSDVVDTCGNIVKRFTTSQRCTTDLTFHAVNNSDGTLCPIQVDD